MDNTTTASQVMGPGVPRVKVFTFNGQQNFANWQHQISRSYVATQMDSMNPKCLETFQELQASIKRDEERLEKFVVKITRLNEEEKKEMQELKTVIASKKAQLLTCQKEDLIFLALFQASVAGAALLTALPSTDTFKLQETPTLPGAIAYDLLQREYTKPLAHDFDRFGDKERLKQYFHKTNLASPQNEIVLDGKVVEFLSKHSLTEENAKNDLYLEMLCEFLHHLPEDHMYETLHVKFRLQVSKRENKATGGKDIFKAAIKEAHEVFTVNQEIQKAGSAMKATAGRPDARSKSNRTRPDAAVEVPSIKNQQQLSKTKNYCLHFNSPDGCHPKGHQSCRYLHEKAPKEILEKLRATLQKRWAIASLASATETLASLATAKKETISSSSNIKSTEFYCCSLSSMTSNGSYLDTGASHTMSPNENMFTDLIMSKIAIHCADNNVIHSAKVGVFHLKTVLHDGTPITLHIKDALFVPNLSVTLISDRSLIYIGYSILIGMNTQLLQNGTKKIALTRQNSGIISFPIPSVYAHQATPVDLHGELPNVNNDSPNIIAVKKPVASVSKVKTVPPVKHMSNADLQLKHESFAHINIDSTIGILRAEGYSISTAQRKAFFCSYCAQSKAKASPAHSDGATSLRPTQPPENNNIVSTVHTDVAGPITPISPKNDQYIISFREDKTNLLWIGTFKSMDQVPTLIAKYIRDMSNTVLSVPIVPNATVMLSDSASVYLSPKTKQLLSDHGIISAASVPYHPKSNSVSERGWQTIFGLTRSMLLAAKERSSLITNEFWPQATAHAVLIINMTTLSHGTNEKSAFEKITNTSPNKVLKQLLPFGCSVFVKLETHHSKLDSNGFHGSVIGYDLTSQGHLVYNHITRKTIVTVNIQPNLSLYYKPNAASDICPDVFNISSTNDDRDGFDDIQSSIQINKVVQDLLLDHQLEIDKSKDNLDDVDVQPDIFKTPPDSPSGLAFLTVTPTSLEKALSGPDKEKWFLSIKKELQSMKDHHVYEAAEDLKQPRMRSFVMLRVKPDDGSETGELFKSRLVAAGNTQEPHRDYDPNRISSSVLKSSSLRFIFLYALENGVLVYHIDVKTAFLNVISEFENYMEMPKILVKEFGVPPLVKLVKALYGTKDAPLLWWQLLHNVLVEELEFVQATNDSCLYFHKQKKIALGVYVDDMPTAASQENYRWVVQELEKRFQVTDKGVLTRCLGMNVIQTIENGSLVSIKLHQP